jgi:hypothetical protein
LAVAGQAHLTATAKAVMALTAHLLGQTLQPRLQLVAAAVAPVIIVMVRVEMVAQVVVEV